MRLPNSFCLFQRIVLVSFFFSLTRLILCPMNPPSIIWVSPLGVVLFGPACYVACGLLDGVLRILAVWKTGVAIPSIFANSSSVPCTFRFGLYFSRPSRPSIFFFYLSLVMKREKTQKRNEFGEAPTTIRDSHQVESPHPPDFLKETRSRLRHTGRVGSFELLNGLLNYSPACCDNEFPPMD